MPRRVEVFGTPPTGIIRSRPALARFVRQRRETKQLECKTLRDLHTCAAADCPYCHGRRLPHGEPVAEAVTAFANGAGGVLIIGAVERPNGSGRFSLEGRACPALTYRADWVTEAIGNLVRPPIDHAVREIRGVRGSPPAYIVDVPASFSLHGWSAQPQQSLRYPIRLAGTVHDMTAPEIEFRVKTKDSVRVNVEFRHEVFDTLWHLFDAVLDRPAETPRRFVNLDQVLRTDPYGVSRLDPGLSRWPNFPEIERAVLEMPAKMAYYSSSRDVELAVESLSYAREDLTQGTLDLSEHRLVSAAKVLARHHNFRERLMPREMLEAIFGDRSTELSTQFMQYDESYEQTFDRIARNSGVPTLDAQTKRQSITGMVDALSLLLPLGFRVLRFYEQLCTQYGIAAIGVESRYFHPRRQRHRH